MLLAWPRKWLGSSGLGMGMEMAEEVWNGSTSKMLNLPQEVRKGLSMTPVVLEAAGTPLPCYLLCLRTTSDGRHSCSFTAGLSLFFWNLALILSPVTSDKEGANSTQFPIKSHWYGFSLSVLSDHAISSASTFQELSDRWASPPACFRPKSLLG